MEMHIWGAGMRMLQPEMPTCKGEVTQYTFEHAVHFVTSFKPLINKAQ